MKIVLALLLAINLFADTYVMSEESFTTKDIGMYHTNYIRTICINGLVFILTNYSAENTSITQVFERIKNDTPSLFPPQPKTCDKR